MDTSHSHASQGEPPPAPPIDNYHHHHHHLPPDEPPPSYDDATGSASAPLLVGPPPDYGAFRAYAEPDESSIASSEVEATDRSLPEWVGQALVVFVFVTIIYGFYRIINAPDSMDDFPG
ncbi:Nn.00g052030.m01.CDS01 [Neocucurbitaria sp. VM-36]